MPVLCVGLSVQALTVITEAEHALASLHEWSKPEAVDTPLVMAPGTSWVQREPLGAVRTDSIMGVPCIRGRYLCGRTI